MLSTKDETGQRVINKENLLVKIFKTRQEAGRTEAADVAQKIVDLLKNHEELNMIFAAAPSQQEFMQSLIFHDKIDWRRINAFHMDEYIGLEEDAPQRFVNFLKERLFDKVPFKTIHYIDGGAANLKKECARYTALLRKHPADIVCLGIGENGHIAFNDPHVADFNDPHWVKVVELDHTCRQQQVNDKCFNVLEEVPAQAITLTIPALTAAEYIFCIVPAKNKAQAVYRTLNEPVSENCPATVLRKKPNAVLYIDEDSASLL